mmetsp:Transcript_30039/g.95992  ORF Transcript_30039/g.95992 Transcript_30039/m.95992 type:complete len:89 (+) Transcript_30039:357-623(+)
MHVLPEVRVMHVLRALALAAVVTDAASPRSSLLIGGNFTLDPALQVRRGTTQSPKPTPKLKSKPKPELQTRAEAEAGSRSRRRKPKPT